jgi:hypothetical protein
MTYTIEVTDLHGLTWVVRRLTDDELDDLLIRLQADYRALSIECEVA